MNRPPLRPIQEARSAVERWLSNDADSHLALLFLASFLIACRMPAQNDTWWHLRAGEDLWRGVSVFSDHYSFTRFGAEWLNREWLSQATFFALFRLGGFPLLTAFLAAGIVTSMTLLSAIVTGPTRKRLVLLALVVVASASQWAVRPQVFSFLFLVLTLWLLDQRRYRLLPIVFLVWANLHAGVILGVAVLVAFCVMALYERTADVRALFVSCAASAVATLLTPLGIRLWTTMPDAIARMRASGVSEFQPLALNAWSSVAFLLLVAGVITLAIRNLWKRGTWDGSVLAAVILCGGAFMSSRNVAAASVLLVVAISRLSVDFDVAFVRSSGSHPRLNRALLATFAAVGLVAISSTWLGGGSSLGWQPLPTPVVEAVNRCEGNLYNRFDDGGYLVWFARSHRVFVDSRFDPYDSRLIQEHAAVEAGGDFASLFRRFNIRCALTVPHSPLATSLAARGWSVAYRDDGWMLLTGRSAS